MANLCYGDPLRWRADTAMGISTIYSLQAYKQCTQGLAAAILDLPLPVTSDSICSMDYASELNDLENIYRGSYWNFDDTYSLEDEIHEPALKVDR